MNKINLEKAVEEYLNGNCRYLESEPVLAKDEYERFEIHTVKRLKRAFELFKGDASYHQDFLMALRDYLLIFDTQISLDEKLVPENDFAIIKDEETNKFFCTYQFPQYVNSKFAKEAFLYGYQRTADKNIPSDLYTDPQIYKNTGYLKFKSVAQKLAVYGALNTPDGYTTLVSLPTGGGKSLITQSMAYQKDGLTIIVMPTTSLAIDQVRTAKKTIRTQNPDEEIFAYYSGQSAEPILNAINNRTAKMLFISPETLIENYRFNEAIKSANKTRYLKNIIIDEAHIVVDWGASFRIEYQCLESWRTKLMFTNPTIRTVLLSATYEKRCVDILKNLFSRDDKWIEIRCDSLRHEPRFMLIKSGTYREKNERLIELVQKMPHPMIIYVARPVDALNLKSILNEKGIKNVETFTGETVASERKELIDKWINDEFEIMVATSAFGVGVDKSDVRTVIHMYIPPNANAYYQELGRGGRDRLPCLSIMCMHDNDIGISFQRISKKVLTTEKIAGRWESMYSNKASQRMDNLIYIDTSIKPSYNVDDPFDDIPSSETDRNWNIYVLLLLRRYNLIRINEVLVQNAKYIFVIEILNDILRNDDDAGYEFLDNIRTREWEYFNSAFQMMRMSIEQSNTVCWSEMFFETYDKVSEYCAGCNAHQNPNENDFYDFTLKEPVRKPFKELGEDQLSFFGQAKEIVLNISGYDKQKIFDGLLKKRVSVFVGTEDIERYIVSSPEKNNMMMVSWDELRDLMKKNNSYYISGLIAVNYTGSEKDIHKQLRLANKYLCRRPEVRVIHIIPDNIFFEQIGKSFYDLIDGAVVNADMLYK